MIAALLDHVWQSSLFAVAAGLATLALKNNSAVIRYWLWFAASMKFLVPFSLLTALGSSIVLPFLPVLDTPALFVLEPAVQPFSGAEPVVTVPDTAFDLTPVFVVLWGAGFVFVLALWLTGFLRLRAALRGARELPLEKPVKVMSSASSMEPGLIGIWRPVLFLPQGIAARISPLELEAILAHELCHLRRRDNLLAVLHMLVEALFWFHPLVWWLGARLTEERERACDEAVLRAGNDPQVYAESILKICKFYVNSPLSCAAGVSGADLRKRVQAILENINARPLDRARKVLLAASAAAVFIAPLGFGLLDSPAALALAEAQALPPPDVIAKNLAEQRAPRKAIALDPKLFDKYVGHYQLGPYIFFTITRNGDHFFARLTGQPDAEIYPESRTKFFATAFVGQLSFETDPHSLGKVTALVLHQTGLEQRAKRIDEATAREMEAALARRIKDNRPMPGAEAALRRFLEGAQKGGQARDFLSPRFAALVTVGLGWRQFQAVLKPLGAVQSVRFHDVDATGRDRYGVDFANGRVFMSVPPPTPDGKLDGIGVVRVFARNPGGLESRGTEAAIRRLIISLQDDRPDYGGMTPSMAAAWRTQWPLFQAQIKSLGPLGAVTFLKVTELGQDAYDVRFANGRVEWRIAPLTSDGKIQGAGFQPLLGRDLLGRQG